MGLYQLPRVNNTPLFKSVQEVYLLSLGIPNQKMIVISENRDPDSISSSLYCHNSKFKLHNVWQRGKAVRSKGLGTGTIPSQRFCPLLDLREGRFLLTVMPALVSLQNGRSQGVIPFR